jgi:hypothetical protein
MNDTTLEAFKAQLRAALQQGSQLAAAVEQRDADWALVVNRLTAERDAALLERDQARAALRALIDGLSLDDEPRRQAIAAAREVAASWGSR